MMTESLVLVMVMMVVEVMVMMVVEVMVVKGDGGETRIKC